MCALHVFTNSKLIIRPLSTFRSSLETLWKMVFLPAKIKNPFCRQGYQFPREGSDYKHNPCSTSGKAPSITHVYCRPGQHLLSS